MTTEVQELNNIITVIVQRIDALTQENSELKNPLSKYETKKNSNNSSIPPSKVENRPKRKSLREKNGRKVGGQKGPKGNTLKMVEEPDFTEKHQPDYCKCCGKDLSDISSNFVDKRQVFDIPKIEIKVTEHQIYKKLCACGHITQSGYPTEANAPASYGNNIESLIGYFHARQYIPFKRMQEIFKDIFSMPISEGGIHYLLDKLVTKAQPVYNLIKSRLGHNTKYAIGSDETGVKVNGEKHWAWTWQNQEATFITITDNRGQKSMTETFKEGFQKSVLVHDCWSSHFNTPALSHQVCVAYLLRDMNYLSELHNHKWGKGCKSVFRSALNLGKRIKKSDYYIHNPKRLDIEKRLDRLLNYELPTKKKELVTFQKRLKKYRDYLFAFLYRPEVPPDNIASGRAIRNVKI